MEPADGSQIADKPLSAVCLLFIEATYRFPLAAETMCRLVTHHNEFSDLNRDNLAGAWLEFGWAYQEQKAWIRRPRTDLPVLIYIFGIYYIWRVLQWPKPGRSLALTDIQIYV